MAGAGPQTLTSIARSTMDSRTSSFSLDAFCGSPSYLDSLKTVSIGISLSGPSTQMYRVSWLACS